MSRTFLRLRCDFMRRRDVGITPYGDLCTLEALCKLQPLQFLLSPAKFAQRTLKKLRFFSGGRHPQSPAVTAPSGREPLESANFGHCYALLSEEGGSEADGWCLGFCTIACGRETPSVTCGDSSLGEGAFCFCKFRASYCRARRLGAPWQGLQWLLFARCFEGAGTFVWIKRILHRLKESCVDKKNKVNSFGIINLLYTAAAVENSFRLASRATSLHLREARAYCDFLAWFAIVRNCELYILLGFLITFRLAQILGSLKWRELSAKLTEGVPARRRQQESP